MIITLVEKVQGNPPNVSQARSIIEDYFKNNQPSYEYDMDDCRAFLDEFEGSGDSWDSWQGNWVSFARRFPGLRHALGVRLHHSNSIWGP